MEVSPYYYISPPKRTLKLAREDVTFVHGVHIAVRWHVSGHGYSGNAWVVQLVIELQCDPRGHARRSNRSCQLVVLAQQHILLLAYDPWVIMLLLYDCQAGAIARVDASQAARSLGLIQELAEIAVAEADEIINEPMFGHMLACMHVAAS